MARKPGKTSRPTMRKHHARAKRKTGKNATPGRPETEARSAGNTNMARMAQTVPIVPVDTTAQDIAASQRKRSAAVQSMQEYTDVIYPPEVTSHPGGVISTMGAPRALLDGAGNIVATADVVPAPVLIPPTVYPASPQGAILVQNHITINIRSGEFHEFSQSMDALIGKLRRSNEISGEAREQLISELRAGRELLNGPKPQRDLTDLLLVKPLKWLLEKSGSAIIGKLAGAALDWLLKMM
jgi:hypothetical protein